MENSEVGCVMCSDLWFFSIEGTVEIQDMVMWDQSYSCEPVSIDVKLGGSTARVG